MAKKTKKRKRSKAFSNFVKATSKGKKKSKKLGIKKKQPRVDPLWDLERDGVTFSLLSKFMNCRERFHIQKVQGWKPRAFNLPLEFGNIFHHMVEAQDMGVSIESMYQLADNYVNAKIHSGKYGPDQCKELSMLAGIVTVTFQQYVLFWESQPSIDHETGKKVKRIKRVYEKDFNWIGKEIPFRIPFKLPNGRQIYLCGKQDGLFDLGKVLKGTWVLETKTKGRIDETGITKGLHKDLQTGMYALAADHEYPATPVAGVLYNCIRRTGMKPRVNDKVKDFVGRVEADIIKRPHYYFMRWSRRISKQDMEEFKQRILMPQVLQIVAWWDSIAKNPMDPFNSQCEHCEGQGTGLTPCMACNGEGSIPNMLHYERPFGTYDTFQYTQRGDCFEIVTENDYTMFEQAEYAHPELEEEDDVEPYLQGIDY